MCSHRNSINISRRPTQKKKRSKNQFAKRKKVRSKRDVRIIIALANQKKNSTDRDRRKPKRARTTTNDIETTRTTATRTKDPRTSESNRESSNQHGKHPAKPATRTAASACTQHNTQNAEENRKCFSAANICVTSRIWNECEPKWKKGICYSK